MAFPFANLEFPQFPFPRHVTMSVAKLLSRITSPDQVLSARDEEEEEEIVRKLHESTFGITSDPLTQFAVVFSALIHDVVCITL